MQRRLRDSDDALLPMPIDVRGESAPEWRQSFEWSGTKGALHAAPLAVGVFDKASGGKRLFTMAPIHHGLQTKGGIFRPGRRNWHEVKIVTRAWIVAAICAMASLALMKVR